MKMFSMIKALTLLLITVIFPSSAIAQPLDLNGKVGDITDTAASSGGYYLRYVGGQAPLGYSHAYQWANPRITCDPNNSPVSFTGSINVGEMDSGGVAFLGLLDKGLLEGANSGYQGGAYAYIYKRNATTVRIGPTDGNLGGEIVQVFKDYTIPAGGVIDLKLDINASNVTVTVGTDSPMTDTYGEIKVLNNGSGYYSWAEFEHGAIPGWDNYPPSNKMTYNLNLTGCQLVETLGPCEVSQDPVAKKDTLLSDCATDKTILIENEWTLDGAGYMITAVDPTGNHFVGSVVKNAGAVAHVTNVRITASGLSNVCDSGANRLRGILFDQAGGSISNVQVSGVRQGLSGCQEGNAIEVRNFDASGNPASEQVYVDIVGNQVSNYQKNGITVSGKVAAAISDNVVTGDGKIDYIAQNGIQISYGATASVISNTISGNWYAPKSWLACGLLFYQSNGVRQQKNTLFDNEKDLCNVGRGGGTFNLEE